MTKKSLGQHFLVDKNIIEKICAPIYAPEVMVEIGPGRGALTDLLVTKTKQLILVEKDPDLIENLEVKFPQCTIINQDATLIDWHQLVDQTTDSILVSNLPYNVGSVIFINLLKSNLFRRMILMFQKEVAQKILQINSKGLWEQNSLGFLSWLYYEAKLVTKVSPTSFHRPPKVDSMVIDLHQKNEMELIGVPFKSIESFTRRLFSQRRKQVQKILKEEFKVMNQQKRLEDIQIDPSWRTETLSNQQILQIFALIER